MAFLKESKSCLLQSLSAVPFGKNQCLCCCQGVVMVFMLTCMSCHGGWEDSECHQLSTGIWKTRLLLPYIAVNTSATAADAREIVCLCFTINSNTSEVTVVISRILFLQFLKHCRNGISKDCGSSWKKKPQTTKSLALHLKEQLQFILIVKSIKFEILFLKCVQKCSPIEETVLTV